MVLVGFGRGLSTPFPFSLFEVTGSESESPSSRLRFEPVGELSLDEDTSIIGILSRFSGAVAGPAVPMGVGAGAGVPAGVGAGAGVPAGVGVGAGAGVRAGAGVGELMWNFFQDVK